MKNAEYVNGIPNFDSPVEKHTRKLKFLFHFPITFSTCDSASVRDWAVRRPATFTLPRKKKRLIAGYIKYVSILCVITLHSCLKTCTNVCERSVGWRHKEMVTHWRMAGPDPRRSPKKFFSALRTSVWSKIKGGPVPPGPSPESATEYEYISIAHGFQLIAGSGRFLEGIQSTSCYGDIWSTEERLF